MARTCLCFSTSPPPPPRNLEMIYAGLKSTGKGTRATTFLSHRVYTLGVRALLSYTLVIRVFLWFPMFVLIGVGSYFFILMRQRLLNGVRASGGLFHCGVVLTDAVLVQLMRSGCFVIQRSTVCVLGIGVAQTFSAQSDPAQPTLPIATCGTATRILTM